jgi:hypothetical protein
MRTEPKQTGSKIHVLWAIAVLILILLLELDLKSFITP